MTHKRSSKLEATQPYKFKAFYWSFETDTATATLQNHQQLQNISIHLRGRGATRLDCELSYCTRLVDTSEGRIWFDEWTPDFLMSVVLAVWHRSADPRPTSSGRWASVSWVLVVLDLSVRGSSLIGWESLHGKTQPCSALFSFYQWLLPFFNDKYKNYNNRVISCHSLDQTSLVLVRAPQTCDYSCHYAPKHIFIP